MFRSFPPGTLTPPGVVTGMMVTVRVADFGGLGREPFPGSGAGAPAGCGAEPREENLGDIGLNLAVFT